jgi:TolA-binding protein
LTARKQAAYFPALVARMFPLPRTVSRMSTGPLPPQRGSLRARASFALLFCAVFALLSAAQVGVADAWPWSGDPEASKPGTAQWWKENKKMAVFDAGQGYKVPGVDGYFDGNGRPITSPIAPEAVIEAGEKKDDVGLIPGLDPRVQYDKVKVAIGLGPNEQFARQSYALGDTSFREKKYKAAAEQFETAISRGPHSSIEQDAMFMRAESYFFADDYIHARDAYDELVKEYSSTRYMDTVIDREWKIAQFWEKKDAEYHHWSLTPNATDKTRPWFDTIGHAVKTYESIRLNDPTGPRADDAIMATANIYFRYGQFEEADYNYTLLRKEYPRSELQFEAHLLGLQAKLRKYQGQDYDGTPLEEAKTLVKQLNSQFSGRLSKEEKDRLGTVSGQLSMEIANRDYRMAAYYDYKEDYGAAKFYYAEVIKKYPDTDVCKKAKDRVAELQGKPDEAPKKLAFLIDMLPESRERTRVARIPELQNGTRFAQAPDKGAASDTNTDPTTTK